MDNPQQVGGYFENNNYELGVSQIQYGTFIKIIR